MRAAIYRLLLRLIVFLLVYYIAGETSLSHISTAGTHTVLFAFVVTWLIDPILGQIASDAARKKV